ncbi:MAG TPA: hypothetical protein GXZ45_12810 [Propionibacterium sp.]|nr:hypothetical protein [Propionibacterium sp.]
MTGSIRALPVVDRLERDGRTLLLLEHRVIELSPLALATYDAASEGVAGLEDLVAVLVAEFGAPPEGDASEGVRRVVDELVGLGLLEHAEG